MGAYRTTTDTIDGREYTLRLADYPGKFEGELLATEAVYEASLHGGADEESGDSESGWYGLMHGLEGITEVDGEPLTKDEAAWLTAHAGAILYMRSDGFVSADYYLTSELLDADWQRVVEADFDPDCE